MQRIKVQNQILQFPDDMSDDDITSIIAKEYPNNGDSLIDLHKSSYSNVPLTDFIKERDPTHTLRTQIKNPENWEYYKNSVSQPQRNETPEDTEYRLYGDKTLGQRKPREMSNSKAFAGNALQGLTFNMGDELSAGIASGVETLTGGDRTYDDFKSKFNQDLQNYNQKNPWKALGGNLTGGIATGIATAPLALGNLVTGAGKLATAGKIGANLADDAIQGGLSAWGDDANISDGAVNSALFGGAVRGVTKGVQNAYKGVFNPNISDETRELANRAREMGVPLSIDQIAPSRVRNTVQKISQVMPYSGVDDFQQTQKLLWNNALAKTLGNGLKDTSPQSINQFVEANGAKFDDVLKDAKINIFNDDIETLNQQREFIKNNVSPIEYKKIDNKINTILSDFKDGTDNAGFKAVSANKISSLRNRLLDLSATSQGDAKHIYSQTGNFVNNILDNSLPQDKIELLKSAKNEYRNFKNIEPLLEGSTDGYINPTDLSDRVKSNKYIKASKTETGKDDVVDLARIGKEFLPKKGGSDTFEKSAYTVGVGGAGTGLIGLAKTAGLGGAAIIANRIYQKHLNQNQKLIDKIINNSATPAKDIFRPNIQGVPINIDRPLIQSLTNENRTNNRQEDEKIKLMRQQFMRSRRL